MSVRVTRGSAGKQAVVTTTSVNNNLPVQSSPLAKKSVAAKTKKTSKTKATLKEKRKRNVPPKVENDPNELPHNLGRSIVNNIVASSFQEAETGEPSEKKQKITIGPEDDIKADIAENSTTAAAETEKSAKKGRKTKDNPYGLTPGVSPFPDWPRPTPEECRIVNELLTEAHGPHTPPPTIPKPSLTVAGCGEVPSILDAMIRTRLSAATTGKNSSMAFQGLVDRFGVLKEGVGKSSVNWDAVRRADVDDVFDAIKRGGLAKSKSRDIKKILDMVYDENRTRCETIVDAESDLTSAPKGTEREIPTGERVEIAWQQENILSLDHLHTLADHEAMLALTKYPGIGVKTASCVLLFCMRRPSFAVDTHVFRLLKWLGWVPPNVKHEDTAYRHVEVKVPDEYKYSLHQLFIQHGKNCGRCRAATSPKSLDWNTGCIIESLLVRTGIRKRDIPVPPARNFFIPRSRLRAADPTAEKNADDGSGLNGESGMSELSDPPNEEVDNAGDSDDE